MSASKRHPLMIGVKLLSDIREEDGELCTARPLGLPFRNSFTEKTEHAARVSLTAKLFKGEDAGDAVGSHITDLAVRIADDGSLAVCFYCGEDGTVSWRAVGVAAGGVGENPGGEATVFGEVVRQEVLFSVDVGLGRVSWSPGRLMASPDIDFFVVRGFGEDEGGGCGAGERHGWECVEYGSKMPDGTWRGN